MSQTTSPLQDKYMKHHPYSVNKKIEYIGLNRAQLLALKSKTISNATFCSNIDEALEYGKTIIKVHRIDQYSELPIDYYRAKDTVYRTQHFVLHAIYQINI